MICQNDVVKAKKTIVTGMGNVVPVGTRGTVLWVAESGDICKVQFYRADGFVGELVDCPTNQLVLIYDHD